MSGIYLVVWDNVNKDKSPVLKSTKGGYPHITVAYTGKELKRDALIRTSSEVYATWALQKVTLSHAKVNSFEDRPGHMRHDVLLMLDAKYAIDIEITRTLSIRERYDGWAKFAMREPHVTHAIYESEAEAHAAAKMLNEAHLPLEVVVTGVTID